MDHTQYLVKLNAHKYIHLTDKSKIEYAKKFTLS